jgi:hypothetical protein
LINLEKIRKLAASRRSGTLKPKGISEVMLLNRSGKGKKYLKLGKRIRQHQRVYLSDGKKSENQADKYRLQKA